MYWKRLPMLHSVWNHLQSLQLWSRLYGIINVDPPVGQGHALEEPGESGVYAQACGAERAVAVRLAPPSVHRIKVIPLGASVSPHSRVTVGRRHHEVPAVDHLCARQEDGRRPLTEGFPCRSSVLVRVWRIQGVNLSFAHHRVFPRIKIRQLHSQAISPLVSWDDSTLERTPQLWGKLSAYKVVLWRWGCCARADYHYVNFPEELKS